MKIDTIARPYLLTFQSSGHTYRISSEEAQRLIDSYPALSATRNRVVLKGERPFRVNVTILRPATRGGGPAFIISKP